MASLRLPREDGETGRSRGFGYVELENREDLIHVLSLPDPSIKGRRIRIELSNENDQQNRQKGNRRFEGFGNSNENRDSGNWRRDNQNNGGGFERNSDRNFDRGGFNRDRKPISEREDDNTPGSWRTNSRQPSTDFSPPRRDRDRDQSDKYRGRNNDSLLREDTSTSEERPKLNLKPRTLPLPEIVTKPDEELGEESVETKVTTKPSGTTSANVFGSAKPVDTATRELEIEERLAEARRQQKTRHEGDVINDKLAEVKIDKNDSENANAETISWRRTQVLDTKGMQDYLVSFYNFIELTVMYILDERRDEDPESNKHNKPRDRNDR